MKNHCFHQGCGSAFILYGSGSRCSSRYGSGSSLTKFVTNYLKELKKTEKMSQKLKVKNHGACPNLLHFFNTIAITTNFLAFFYVFSLKFSLVDPDPDFECGSGSRTENECGSGSRTENECGSGSTPWFSTAYLLSNGVGFVYYN